MIADLKPYPGYKESASPWLGQFPAHWQLQRLGSVLRERGATNELKLIDQVLSVMKDIGVIRYEDKGRVGNKKSEDTARYKVVRPDDIVVNCMNVIIGSVGISRYTGCLSPVYYILTRRSEMDNPRYFNAVFQIKPFQMSLVRIGNGILAHRMRIPMELLKCEPFPVPPPDEQAAIVRFLDHVNRRIERTIRAKRKIIALLNEQKQVIIHGAVTRGLDPNVRLKPSGIPWLGDIPEHWEITKLKHLSPQITVGIVIQPARLYVSKGVPCLRSLNISSGSIMTDDLVFISQESHRANRKSQLNEGDIVIVRTGRTGVAVIVSKAFHGANCIDLLICRKSSRLLSAYLLEYLRSHGAKSDIAFNSVGAIQAHYNTTTLANLRIPLPSITEQESILHWLETALAPIDNAIARTLREIDLLREYRTRLIADVVTGKLDVREAAKNLPDQAEIETLPEEADEGEGKDTVEDGEQEE